MSLDYVTITGTFQDGAGNPLSGSVTFTPSTTAYAAGVPLFTTANPVSGVITGGSLLTAQGDPLMLLATDNTGLVFEDLTGFFYWTVTVSVPGVSVSFSFFLPHSPSTIDLFELANTGAGAGSGISLPLSLADGGTGTAAGSDAAALAALGGLPIAGGAMAGALAPAVVALTDAATVTPDASDGNDFRLHFTSAIGSTRVIAAPTSPADGQPMTFEFQQPASGGPCAVTWASGAGGFDFGGGSAPTLSTAASAIDLAGFRYSSAKGEWLYLGTVDGF